MCMSSRQYTTVKVVGTLLSVVNRVLRSFAFNILIFALGFTVGYIFVDSKVHYYAVQHPDMVYLQRLTDKMDEMAEMDKAYMKKQEEVKQMIRELKAKFSYDVHYEYGNPIVDKLFIQSQD